MTGEYSRLVYIAKNRHQNKFTWERSHITQYDENELLHQQVKTTSMKHNKTDQQAINVART